MIDITKLDAGDFVIVTDDFGKQRTEIVTEVNGDEIITIGFAGDSPVAKSIEEIDLLDNLPLCIKRYNKECILFAYRLGDEENG